MFKSNKIIVVFLIVAVAYTTSEIFEEDIAYAAKPSCKPSSLDKGIKCSEIGTQVEIQGGLYGSWEFHYVPLASAYYVARLADALGYSDCCPTNLNFLRSLNIVTPWSGVHGPDPVGIAIDGACGFDRNILRRCTFPNADYPFLCYGSAGNPPTYGERLGTLSYNSVLQGSNKRWALFVHCWGAKSPENPNAEPIATSFNVFNLDPVLSIADRNLIINKLKDLKFKTTADNLIEFNYNVTSCACNGS